MKKHLLLLISLGVWLRCQPPSVITQKQAPVDTASMTTNAAATFPADTVSYFQASGTEPFWNVNISDSVIRFTSLVEGFEQLSAPHVEPLRAMDANVKMYRADTESGRLAIEIKHNECVNGMSGEVSPYQVTVNITPDQEATEFEGCGQYIPNYRLHDLWVLESLKGVPVGKTQFPQEYPSLEINTREASFMGFAGCNRMRGKLFAERDLLRFTDIITTRMACPPPNAEAEFLMALRSATTFRIGRNRLHLSNPQGELLIFKKID